MNDLSYNNWYAMSDLDIHRTLGSFIKSHRLEQNISQTDLASRAGISRSTLSLLERGENVALSTLIQAMRALNLLHIFKEFQYEQKISPIEVAKQEKKQRKHAYTAVSKSNYQENSEW